MPGKDIEIIKHLKDEGIVVSQRGVEIHHKGKPITVEMAELGLVYLVIDSSESMGEGDKLEQAKKGAIDFAKDAKTKGYSVGLIKFDSIATHLCEPQREISVLARYLRAIEAGNTTNMADAIHLAYQKLKDRKGSRVIVVVTDGMPDSEEDALETAKKAKNNKVDIITIGTDDADRNFLRKLASQAELGVKVTREQLGQSIASTAKILPQLGEGRSEK